MKGVEGGVGGDLCVLSRVFELARIRLISLRLDTEWW